MRIYKNIPKRILSLCLVFAIGISMGVLPPTTLFLKLPFSDLYGKINSGPKYAAIPSPFTTLLHTLKKKVSESPRQLLELHFLTRLRPPVSVRNMRKS